MSAPSLSLRGKGLVVLGVQLALVLSIAAKFAWERHSCPMVWTRTYQYDPSLPLRGRYLALTLTANACGMPKGDEGPLNGWLPMDRSLRGGPNDVQQWRVHTIARNGVLAIAPAPDDDSQNAQGASLGQGFPCEAARLDDLVDFFVSEKAAVPPLKSGESMWVLVTVPPSGPPRPVKVAVSGATGWHPLDLR
jgi:hypothetical protein